MTISARNVELKARDPDPARTLERALALGAEDHGTIHQRDTYFAGARGRLKLRQQSPVKTSRHHWVLKAIAQRIQREASAEGMP